MNWIELTSEEQLNQLIQQSSSTPQLIFKHSTRCSISIMAKSRLDREASVSGVDFYYLDLLQHRSVSNKIADVFNVIHQSPQVLLIKKGECVYEETHNAINIEEIREQVGV
jgi:bacillithiol system protein YtxJ